MWHYILFLSEAFIAHMILHLSWTFSPARASVTLLSFTAYFCYFLHLCFKGQVSLSGHAALGFLTHSDDFNCSLDTGDSQISISNSTLIQS